MERELLDIHKAAQRYGKSETFWYHQVSKGTLKSWFKVGGEWRAWADELDKELKEEKEQQND